MQNLSEKVDDMRDKGRFKAMYESGRITHLDKLTSASVRFSCWAKEQVCFFSREKKQSNLFMAEEMGVVETPVNSQVIRLYLQYLGGVIAEVMNRHGWPSSEEYEQLWQNKVPAFLTDFYNPGTRMETDFRIGIKLYVVVGVIEGAKRRRCLVRPSSVYDSSNGIMLDDLKIPVFFGNLCEKIDELYQKSQIG